MKITSGILKRVAVPAVVMGMALPLTLATSAAAQQPGPASTVFRIFGYVAYSAYSGENNKVTVSVGPGNTLVVEDKEGIVAGRGCQQATDLVAVCGAAQTVTRIVAQLRDGTDVLFVGVDKPSSVDAGPGSDVVETSGGNDTIDVRDGVNNNDTVTSCGGGTDTAAGNPGDYLDLSCERRIIN
ncbi:hypothetical protein J7I98_09205 [Streptomyces sp. ISL-98]|uniref:hypothetical protein n=1 Tax=Streptomyces sp. ISL-98 TaxID=2819192 RepID=UPI001BE67E56|nr:hypothetical protein [Streptomyces sp. ISL-98]MBT2506069.1 hypothetical protein [Streptomyces sp. ISL-98]